MVCLSCFSAVTACAFLLVGIVQSAPGVNSSLVSEANTTVAPGLLSNETLGLQPAPTVTVSAPAEVNDTTAQEIIPGWLCIFKWSPCSTKDRTNLSARQTKVGVVLHSNLNLHQSHQAPFQQILRKPRRPSNQSS